MDTILETNVAPELVRGERKLAGQQPRPEWVRGTCPQCGGALVSACYYVGGKGYLVAHECWESLGEEPTCSYRKVL